MAEQNVLYVQHRGNCFFCKKSWREAGALAMGRDKAYICVECALACARLIAEVKPKDRLIDNPHVPQTATENPYAAPQYTAQSLNSRVSWNTLMAAPVTWQCALVISLLPLSSAFTSPAVHKVFRLSTIAVAAVCWVAFNVKAFQGLRRAAASHRVAGLTLFALVALITGRIRLLAGPSLPPSVTFMSGCLEIVCALEVLLLLLWRAVDLLAGRWRAVDKKKTYLSNRPHKI